MSNFSHGDRVEFLKDNQWWPGTVYAIYRDTVIIRSDDSYYAGQLFDRPFDQVRHAIQQYG